MRIDKILVPLDGSPLSEAALPTALALAEGSGASILLLRAVEAGAMVVGDPTDIQVKIVGEAEEYLHAVKIRLQAESSAPISTTVWYGYPPEAIAETARVNHVDVIVMTTHGRSGLGRLLVGSVTESVIRSTPTPILVLHPQGAPLQASSGQSRPASAGQGSPSVSAEQTER